MMMTMMPSWLISYTTLHAGVMDLSTAAERSNQPLWATYEWFSNLLRQRWCIHGHPSPALCTLRVHGAGVHIGWLYKQPAHSGQAGWSSAHWPFSAKCPRDWQQVDRGHMVAASQSEWPDNRIWATSEWNTDWAHYEHVVHGLWLSAGYDLCVSCDCVQL